MTTSITPDSQITSYYVTAFQDIVEDYNQRWEAQKTNFKTLDSGYWYANDYYSALKAHKEQSTIDFFVQRDKFYYGHMDENSCLQHVTVKPLNYPGENKPSYLYSLKLSKTASEGLASIQSSLCFIDCQEAIEIAQYKTLQHFMTKERFDDKFAADGNTPMTFYPRFPLTPLKEFVEDVYVPNPANVTVGTRMFFRNIPFYTIKHPLGELSGDNMLCIAPGKYTSLGSPKDGLTISQIYERHIDEFNQPEEFSQELVTPQLWEACMKRLGEYNQKQRKEEPNQQTNMTEFMQVVAYLKNAAPEKQVGYSGLGGRLNQKVIESYIP